MQVVICPLQRYIKQMDMCGWEQIKVKWADNAKCVFYGCNTANPKAKLNFAQNISNLPNFKNVEVWGQPSYSYPSFFPDYRATSLERSLPPNFDAEILWQLKPHTYMVAGEDNKTLLAFNAEALDSLIKHYYPFAFKLLNKDVIENLKKFVSIKALPMNCYKNGKFIIASHQGIFNDHNK